MLVTIKLFGPFRRERFSAQSRQYPQGTTVEEVIDDLNLSRQLLGIILINGIHAEQRKILQEGDELSLLPLLEGG